MIAHVASSASVSRNALFNTSHPVRDTLRHELSPE
jgi:hypothetical protein